MSNQVFPSKPPNNVVAAMAVPDMHLGSSEQFIFDVFAQEHTRISGTQIEYFPLDVQKSKKDPLYNEASVRVFDGPYDIMGWVELPIGSSEVLEEGLHKTFGPKAWLARKEVEDQRMAPPMIGDVLHIWNLPFYNMQSTGDHNRTPGAGYYFGVVEVNTDGHMFDTATFVGFTLNLKRLTEFTPERRVDRPKLINDNISRGPHGR